MIDYTYHMYLEMNQIRIKAITYEESIEDAMNLSEKLMIG